MSYNPDAPLVTLEDIQSARLIVDASPHCVRTPMLHHVQAMFNIDASIDLYLKLENMQTTGSFKIRGVTAQLSSLEPGHGKDCKLVTMSAGNYGKSFAYMCQQLNFDALVLMPETAPANRVDVIQGYGAEVERLPSLQLQPTVDRYVEEKGMIYMHSFDDTKLMAGHGSAGLEIIEELPDVDIVVVCCGGGGLVGGIASAIKLSGLSNCRIYAVEPEGSKTMYESFRVGHAVKMPVKSVASGLSPPFAGINTYKHCMQFVEDILLVSDEEIIQAMFALYDRGLVVEPSGAAALYFNHIPDVKGKKVAVVITGGNVSPAEFVQHKSGS